jgi:hypothetical protein
LLALGSGRHLATKSRRAAAPLVAENADRLLRR